MARVKMLIARESGVTVLKDGTEHTYVKGTTLIREDSALAKAVPENFEPSGTFREDVEQATAAPGEKRGTKREVKK